MAAEHAAVEEGSAPTGDNVLPLENLTNKAFVELIVSRIRQEIVPRTTSSAVCRLEVSKLETDYWSYIFQVNWRDAGGPQGVFVKIPRCPWDDDTMVHALSNPRAIQMGGAEFLSLSRLYEFWEKQPRDKEFGAIKPLAYWPEWNAIVTEKVFGSDLHLVLRRNRVHSNEVAAMIGALGKWLADFQLSFDNSEIQFLDSHEYGSDIEEFWSVIRSHSKFRKKIDRLARRVKQIRLKGPQKMCPHIEGFEVRNVIVEKKSNRLFVLDPGQITRKCYLENVVDFLISLDILYWGTAWFIFSRKPPRAVGHAFLQGFLRRAEIAHDWFLFFKIKELIHSWSAACLVLERKKIPVVLKLFFQTFYIDRFYIDELESCLVQLR